MASGSEINNEIYDDLGDRWYTADDDPVALLRAENKVKTPWILERIKEKSQILDVGCGAGFLANDLARHGHQVTGLDLSTKSLEVAKRYDVTKSVHYITGDAFRLPFEDESFDVVCAMDFLEHIEAPEKAIAEFTRVLKPGGRFFFHTFNRNLLAWLVVIKLVEWLIPKTPKNMHILRLFIKPNELTEKCEQQGLKVIQMSGIKPVISSIPFMSVFSGRVPASMRFELTSSMWISYMGYARKRAV